jgi:MoxR-like ATPase
MERNTMNIRNILRVAWFTPGPKKRWGLPILFEGHPGTGKTAHVEQEAAAVGLDCEVLISSIREPSDFGGLPMPTTVDGKSKLNLLAPPWAQRLADKGRGLIFGDELNTSPPAVQAAFLRIVTDAVVGDLELPRTVRICAAQNSVEEAAGGWDLAAPLANRFGHIRWETPTVAEWSDWLLSSGNGGQSGSKPIDPETEEKRVLEAFANPWAQARGLISGFLRARPELLFKMPQAGSPEASRAWPSPRTWEYAARALAGSQVHGIGALETDELVAAFVGTGAAAEFNSWRATADLPAPDDVLDEKVKFKHDTMRLDRTVAVLSSCAALLTTAQKDVKPEQKKARSTVLWRMIDDISKEAADVTVPAARALAKAGMAVGKEAQPALVRLQPILTGAGIKAAA